MPKKSTQPEFIDESKAQKLLKANWTDGLKLFEQRQAVDRLFQEFRTRLIALPEVSGLHVGLRRKWDPKKKCERIALPLEYCIRVHVYKKLPDDAAELRNSLKVLFPQLPIDVFEQSYRRSAVKAAAGDPISNPKIGLQGTMGGVVFSGTSQRFITNQHIAGSIVGDPVFRNGTERIGTVIDAIHDNFIDAAIILPEIKGDIFNYGPIKQCQFQRGVLIPGIDDRAEVSKYGAMTGFTTGFVSNLDATLKIDGFPMDNQILVSGGTAQIANHGDSGSLLVVVSDHNDTPLITVVGLVHAVGEDSSGNIGTTLVASHFASVQSKFGIDAS